MCDVSYQDNDSQLFFVSKCVRSVKFASLPNCALTLSTLSMWQSTHYKHKVTKHKEVWVLIQKEKSAVEVSITHTHTLARTQCYFFKCWCALITRREKEGKKGLPWWHWNADILATCRVWRCILIDQKATRAKAKNPWSNSSHAVLLTNKVTSPSYFKSMTQNSRKGQSMCFTFIFPNIHQLICKF